MSVSAPSSISFTTNIQTSDTLRYNAENIFILSLSTVFQLRLKVNLPEISGVSNYRPLYRYHRTHKTLVSDEISVLLESLNEMSESSLSPATS